LQFCVQCTAKFCSEKTLPCKSATCRGTRARLLLAGQRERETAALLQSRLHTSTAVLPEIAGQIIAAGVHSGRVLLAPRTDCCCMALAGMLLAIAGLHSWLTDSGPVAGWHVFAVCTRRLCTDLSQCYFRQLCSDVIFKFVYAVLCGLLFLANR